MKRRRERRRTSFSSLIFSTAQNINMQFFSLDYNHACTDEVAPLVDLFGASVDEDICTATCADCVCVHTHAHKHTAVLRPSA